VLPITPKQGSGHIIDIISGISFVPMAYQTMYAATKAALNGLTLAP
jgi:short-subunit dehydrogenase